MNAILEEAPLLNKYFRVIQEIVVDEEERRSKFYEEVKSRIPFKRDGITFACKKHKVCWFFLIFNLYMNLVVKN